MDMTEENDKLSPSNHKNNIFATMAITFGLTAFRLVYILQSLIDLCRVRISIPCFTRRRHTTEKHKHSSELGHHCHGLCLVGLYKTLSAHHGHLQPTVSSKTRDTDASTCTESLVALQLTQLTSLCSPK